MDIVICLWITCTSAPGGNLLLDCGLVDCGDKLGLQEALPKNTAGGNSARCWRQHKGYHGFLYSVELLE